MVLLQKKARGFGVGKWNAPGGKVDKGEDTRDSVTREVREETTLSVFNLKEIGFHEFVFQDKEIWNNRCYIYITKDFRGKPKDMGEGELKWFPIDEIPLEEMWDDDKYWTKEMLKGKFKNTRFFFDSEGKYLKHEIINN